MNLNDYKDGNGNVEVSETLVSDIIGGINGVVASGSNENGRWVKLDDGTQICWSVVTPDRSLKNTSQEFVYPAGFIDVPAASASHIWGINVAYQESCGTMFLSYGSNTWRVGFTNTTITGATLPMQLLAVGRWK